VDTKTYEFGLWLLQEGLGEEEEKGKCPAGPAQILPHLAGFLITALLERGLNSTSNTELTTFHIAGAPYLIINSALVGGDLNISSYSPGATEEQCQSYYEDCGWCGNGRRSEAGTLRAFPLESVVVVSGTGP